MWRLERLRKRWRLPPEVILLRGAAVPRCWGSRSWGLPVVALGSSKVGAREFIVGGPGGSHTQTNAAPSLYALTPPLHAPHTQRERTHSRDVFRGSGLA